MKKAAGEANMTVIVVVLIGVVAAVGLIIIPKLMAKVKIRSCCTEFGGRPYRCHDDDSKVCCNWSGQNIDSNGIRSAFRSCKENSVRGGL